MRQSAKELGHRTRTTPAVLATNSAALSRSWRRFPRSITQESGNPRASPSDHLEVGESILSAAVRETKEETGIALGPAALRLALSIHERHPGTTHARIGFAFERASWHGEPVNAEPGKCSELRWADPYPPSTGHGRLHRCHHQRSRTRNHIRSQRLVDA